MNAKLDLRKESIHRLGGRTQAGVEVRDGGVPNAKPGANDGVHWPSLSVTLTTIL